MFQAIYRYIRVIKIMYIFTNLTNMSEYSTEVLIFQKPEKNITYKDHSKQKM